jgi:hypothetical protein
MTVAAVPYVEQNLSHSAALFRQAFATSFASGGICSSGELAVAAQSSPNMTVQVAAGRAIVPGTSVSPPSGFTFTTQGSYFVLNDATISVTISTANATNPRIDVVYVGVQDAFYSGSTNTALISVVTGTPAPSPSAPAIPTNAVALAQVAVAANATSIVNANITAVATLATSLVNSPAIPFASAAGANSNLVGAFKAITFPASRFTVAPLVFLTMNGAVAGIGIVGSPTSSGCNAGGFSSGGSAVASSWNWFAVQMTATSASG